MFNVIMESQVVRNWWRRRKEGLAPHCACLEVAAMGNHPLRKRNLDGDTPFSKAIRIGAVDVAILIMQTNDVYRTAGSAVWDTVHWACGFSPCRTWLAGVTAINSLRVNSCRCIGPMVLTFRVLIEPLNTE